MKFLTLILLFALSLLADAPQQITISVEKDEVIVTATHATDAPAKHYIKEVQMQINGVASSTGKPSSGMDGNTSTQSFSSQEDPNQQVAIFILPQAPHKGDQVTVKVICSTEASKTQTMTVGVDYYK